MYTQVNDSLKLYIRQTTDLTKCSQCILIKNILVSLGTAHTLNWLSHSIYSIMRWHFQFSTLWQIPQYFSYTTDTVPLHVSLYALVLWSLSVWFNAVHWSLDRITKSDYIKLILMNCLNIKLCTTQWTAICVTQLFIFFNNQLPVFLMILRMNGTIQLHLVQYIAAGLLNILITVSQWLMWKIPNPQKNAHILP